MQKFDKKLEKPQQNVAVASTSAATGKKVRRNEVAVQVFDELDESLPNLTVASSGPTTRNKSTCKKVPVKKKVWILITCHQSQKQ